MEAEMSGNESIDLKYPIGYVFLGAFQKEEIEIIHASHLKRIGKSEKIQYAIIKSDERKEELSFGHSYNLKTDRKEEGGLKSRKTIRKEKELFLSVEEIVDSYYVDFSNAVNSYRYPERGRAHFNLVVKAEDKLIPLLETLITKMKEKFTDVFINGIVIDIYCILDETLEKGEEKGACIYDTLNCLKGLEASGMVNMIYLLSNMNNFGVVAKKTTHNFEAIALLSMLKAGESVRRTENEYSDTDFKYLAKREERKFFTAGHLKLEKPNGVMELIVYRTLFEAISVNLENDELRFLAGLNLKSSEYDAFVHKYIENVAGYLPECLFPVFMKREGKLTDLLGLTKEEAMHAVFGNQIEMFFEDNVKHHTREEWEEAKNLQVRRLQVRLKVLFDDMGLSFFEMHKFLAKDGMLYQSVKAEYDGWSEKGSILAQNLDHFKKSDFVLRGGNKKRKDVKVYEAYYSLAEEYLELAYEAYEVSLYQSLLADYLKLFLKLSEDYYNYVGYVEHAKAELSIAIEYRLRTENVLLAGNMEGYYRDITNQAMKEREHGRFHDMMLKLHETECSKERLYEEVYQFGSYLMQKELDYHEPFSEEITNRLSKMLDPGTGVHLYDKEKIFELAYSAIFEKVEYGIRIIADNNLHKEICLFVQEENELIDYIKNRMEHDYSEYQLHFFYERKVESMEIVYLLGCFDERMLSRYSGYRKAYKNLTEKEAEEDGLKEMGRVSAAEQGEGS